MRLSDFRRSVGETMKTFGQSRPVAVKERPRTLAGDHSEAAVRERLYGKRDRRR